MKVLLSEDCGYLKRGEHDLDDWHAKILIQGGKAKQVKPKRKTNGTAKR